MDIQQIINQTQDKLLATIERYKVELSKLRTGRANSAILDGIMVEAYGTPMPLHQIANIIAPEAQLLQITPFDPNNLQAISNAIRENQTLGLNPSDDGRVVRVPIPPLTEERRREITKQVSAKLEETMIVTRGIRHEAIDAIEQSKKDKNIGEDEAKRLVAQIEEAMNKAKNDAEIIEKSKIKEIMTV